MARPVAESELIQEALDDAIGAEANPLAIAEIRSALAEARVREAVHGKADAETVAFLREELGTARENEGAERTLSEYDKGALGKVGGALARTGLGIGRGAANVVDAVTGLFSDTRKPLVDKKGAADRALMDKTSGQIGNFIGETLATAPVGGVAGGAVKGIAGRVLGKTLAKSLAARAATTGLGLAAEGAAPAALMAEPGERGTSAAIGGVLGAGVPGAGKLLKKTLTGAFRPAAGSAAADLMAKGVEITPGQAQKWWRPFEDIGASGPLGSRTTAAREAAEQGARHSGIDLGDLAGQSTKGTKEIPERLAAQHDNLSAAYENLLTGQKMYPSVRPGGGSMQRVDKALRGVVDAVEGASNAEREAALGIIENEMTRGNLKGALAGKGALPKVDASDMNRLRSALKKGAAAQRMKGEANVAEMLENAAETVDNAIEEQLPQIGQEIGELRRAYKMNARISEASGAAQMEGGRFTPRQLRAAATKGHSKANVGRGKGVQELTDLADQTQEVFRTGANTGQKNVLTSALAALGAGAGGVAGGPMGAGAGAVLGFGLPMIPGVMASGVPRKLLVGQTARQTRWAGRKLTPKILQGVKGRAAAQTAARIAALRGNENEEGY